MTTRGIATEAVDKFRLGIVDDHPMDYLIGRLSIPFMTMTGIIGIKYRCLRNHDCKAESCPKYLYDDGEEPRLYNAGATLRNSQVCFITEGEIDTIAIQSMTGLPSAAVPGAQLWAKNRYWARCFAPFPLVVMTADGDKAGKELAKIISSDIPQARIVHMPTNQDANDVLRLEGVEKFLLRCDFPDEWIERVLTNDEA